MTDKTIKEFWLNYSKLDDYFDRREKLKTLPFIKDLPSMLKSDEQNTESYRILITYLFTSHFQSYIDDVLDNIKAKDLK